MDSSELVRRTRRVELLLLDVDGVLTDGGVYLGDGVELKRFDIQDGMGVTLARRAGLRVGILTGRTSSAVTRRARELAIDEVIQGANPKLPAFTALLERLGLDGTAVAYMGDDLQDLPVLGRVGLALAPANARPEVRERAHWVATASGGRGAVREAVEMLLSTRGEWGDLVRGYLAP